MPVDLNRLTEGWLELESDPGLFTLLLEDFGVQGIQVEEIYDLQKPIEGPVYGFIFLFKWIEERRSRRKFLSTEECFIQNEDIVNSMFFAQQMVPNSCATHALLSVLLNCDFINIGNTLSNFRDYTKKMSPENKGLAIGNCPELARAHNSHAKPMPQHFDEKLTHGVSRSGKTMDAFHFVSYVPINGHLYELDGLRPFPLDHGPLLPGQEWTEKFRLVIKERLGIATRGEPYHDIRFNLMAVVPDRRKAYESKLKTLKTNRKIVMVALQQLIRKTQPELLSHSDVSSIKSTSSFNFLDSASQMLPPALDNHNYAKSPLMSSSFHKQHDDVHSDSETSSCDEGDMQNEKTGNKSSKEEISLPKFEPISVQTDNNIIKPLSIQTHLSPTFSTSSTDTSSEIGSAFNSPSLPKELSQVSPNGTNTLKKAEEFAGISKFVCIRVTSKMNNSNFGDDVDGDENLTRVASSDNNSLCDKPKSSTDPDNYLKFCNSSIISSKIGSMMEDKVEPKEILTGDKLLEPHKFAPKDLLALLKTLESEINGCETNLKDEIEKRKRFKIDDSRRTHNYDQFISLFISMLSEQNKLSSLIKQNCMVKRRQGIPFSKAKKDRRRRARPRKKK